MNHGARRRAVLAAFLAAILLSVVLVFASGCGSKVDWYIITGFQRGADGQVQVKLGPIVSSPGEPSPQEFTQLVLSRYPSFFSDAPIGELVYLSDWPGAEQAKTLIYQTFGEIGYRLEAFKVTGSIPTLSTLSSTAATTSAASGEAVGSIPTLSSSSSTTSTMSAASAGASQTLTLDEASSALLESIPFSRSTERFSIRALKGWETVQEDPLSADGTSAPLDD